MVDTSEIDLSYPSLFGGFDGEPVFVSTMARVASVYEFVRREGTVVGENALLILVGGALRFKLFVGGLLLAITKGLFDAEVG